MQIASVFRAGLIALMAMVGASVWSAASADSGTIRISVLKAGWLTFHGRRYPLSIGGLSAGFVFGASQTDLVGRVSNVRRASDVTGVYGAAGAAAAVGSGARTIV
jgi:hypothetical protein